MKTTMSQTKQVELPQFGDKIQIEMKRYGIDNELFTHKVVNTLRSNTWVDVPVQSPATEVMHDHMEDVVSAICEGVSETEVLKYRVQDVKIIHSVAQAKQEVAERERKEFIERLRNTMDKYNSLPEDAVQFAFYLKVQDIGRFFEALQQEQEQ